MTWYDAEEYEVDPRVTPVHTPRFPRRRGNRSAQRNRAITRSRKI